MIDLDTRTRTDYLHVCGGESETMTESEWLNCCDPTRMLGFIRRQLSARKQRLYAVACCRRIWPLFAYHDSREAVEAAERYAEGMAREKELANYHHAALMVVQECTARFRSTTHAATSAAQAATNATEERLCWAAENVTGPELDPAIAAAAASGARACQLRPRPEEGSRAGAWAELEEQRCQSEILRDLVGNPFRQTLFERSWLTWSNGVVKGLAVFVYEGQAFDRLPILADALEDAGCTDPVILEHLRGPGPHFRGCFALDLIL